MEKYNYTIIEDWWRHLGCFDREQVTDIPYYGQDQINDYLYATDDWWDSLTDDEKLEKYNEFFSEN